MQHNNAHAENYKILTGITTKSVINASIYGSIFLCLDENIVSVTRTIENRIEGLRGKVVVTFCYIVSCKTNEQTNVQDQIKPTYFSYKSRKINFNSTSYQLTIINKL